MPTWWCKVCGRQIAPDDVITGPGGKQYHSVCLTAYYNEQAIHPRPLRARARSRRRPRILLLAGLGLLAGCAAGILASPTGGFAIVGGLLGVLIGGIVGQQTQ